MADLTYGELRLHSERVREEPPVKDFELALSELIQIYRHRAPRTSVIEALARQGSLVSEDDGWQEPNTTNPDAEPAPEAGEDPQGEAETEPQPEDTPPAA